MKADITELSNQQIIRLLRVIVNLPNGPRRDRFFRYLVSTNAPLVICGLPKLPNARSCGGLG